MKKVAVTVAVLALGLAACTEERRQQCRERDRGREQRGLPTSTPRRPTPPTRRRRAERRRQCRRERRQRCRQRQRRRRERDDQPVSLRFSRAITEKGRSSGRPFFCASAKVVLWPSEKTNRLRFCCCSAPAARTSRPPRPPSSPPSSTMPRTC